MERFTGQDLGSRPHIAVLFNDSTGNFTVSTPLLRGLREKWSGCTVDYYGGPRTRELEEASPLIDSRADLVGGEKGLRALVDYARQREEEAGPYDLVVNLDFHPVNALVTTMLSPRYVVGSCFGPDLRKELPWPPTRLTDLATAIWTRPRFLEEFGDVVSSNFIGEIFCRLAGIETDYHRTQVPWAPPLQPVPDILIATGASRPAKLWPAEYWEGLLNRIGDRGLTVGLLGDKPSAQGSYYHCLEMDEHLLANTALQDLRGRFTLPQVSGALKAARAAVTIDNGIMHMAVGVGTPTVALFGASSWRLWVPHMDHLRLVLPETPCPLCEENNFRNPDCLRPSKDQICMRSISPEAAMRQLEGALEDRGT